MGCCSAGRRSVQRQWVQSFGATIESAASDLLLLALLRVLRRALRRLGVCDAPADAGQARLFTRLARLLLLPPLLGRWWGWAARGVRGGGRAGCSGSSRSRPEAAAAAAAAAGGPFRGAGGAAPAAWTAAWRPGGPAGAAPAPLRRHTCRARGGPPAAGRGGRRGAVAGTRAVGDGSGGALRPSGQAKQPGQTRCPPQARQHTSPAIHPRTHPPTLPAAHLRLEVEVHGLPVGLVRVGLAQRAQRAQVAVRQAVPLPRCGLRGGQGPRVAGARLGRG